MIKNIVFDWSGTLVNDLPVVLTATNYILKKLGKGELSLEQFRAEFCLPFLKFYERMAPGADMKQLGVWFYESLAQGEDTVEPLPHAEEFLKFVKSNQLQTFLFSSIPEAHYKKLIQKIPFAQYLDHPYVALWDKKARILELIEKHRIDPQETLFIGDMIHDIETAHFGKMHSCAVLSGYTRQVDLETSHPELIVEHLGILMQGLERAHFDCEKTRVEVGKLTV